MTGEVMDTVLLTKPPGFQLNATVRASQLSSFEPDVSLGNNWIDTYGALSDSCTHALGSAAWCEGPCYQQPAVQLRAGHEPGQQLDRHLLCMLETQLHR